MDAPYVARPELNGLRTYIRRLDGGLWPPRHDVFRTPPPFHPRGLEGLCPSSGSGGAG